MYGAQGCLADWDNMVLNVVATYNEPHQKGITGESVKHKSENKYDQLVKWTLMTD